MPDFIQTSEGLINLEKILRTHPIKPDWEYHGERKGQDCLIIVLGQGGDYGTYNVRLYGEEAQAVERYLLRKWQAADSDDFRLYAQVKPEGKQ